MRHEFAGDVAIVRCANAGFGTAAGRELARRGARVVFAVPPVRGLDEQVAAIVEDGSEAIAVATDLSDPAQVAWLVERARQTFGRVDVLVDDVDATMPKPLLETSPDEIAASLKLHLVGTMRLTRAVLPEMLQRGRGAIVSVRSVQGRMASDSLASATAFGVRGFSLALRRQLAGSGVSVSLVTAARRSRPELVGRTVADVVIRPRREVIVPATQRAIVWLDDMLPGLRLIGAGT